MRCDFQGGQVEARMTSEGLYADYQRGWRVREAQRTARLRALAEQARAEAVRLAHLLAAEFGATRVILFGSLAHGDPTREEFDIDLAVEGIAPERIHQAGGSVRMAASREVDLVDLAAVSDRMRLLIMEQGVTLYDQGRDSQIDR